ncbi:viral A-type inclusion protein [Clostridium celatum]|uniref:viral A-type inclusion protein n=1 Tax=Clostridium celatum TaxID=36834 RepID=UPI00189A2E73|nr:viral A-type inclusion protein [Clostridium celatum]
MAMKKFNIFAGDNNEKEEFFKENNNDILVKDQKESEIIDVTLMSYIRDEFPEVAEKIKESLKGLKDTLEESIDYIEEKSSNIVKEDRNFTLSGKYREISMELYNIANNIKNYIEWMENADDTNDKKDDNDKNNGKKDEKDSLEEKKNEIDSKGGNEVLLEKDDEENTAIYEDFTSKEPRLFKLDNHKVEVENWDDMIVKTAAVLTKNYKGNKFLKFKNNNKVKVVKRKSKQNEFRDTIIEMLRDYNVSLHNYRVILK